MSKLIDEGGNLNTKSARRSSGVAIAALAVIGMLASRASAGDPVHVLFDFEEEDGSYPDTDLVIDSAGNRYGTTVQAGDDNDGTVFSFTP